MTLRSPFCLLISTTFPSLPSNGPDPIVTYSPTCISVLYSSLFSSSIPFNCSSSSPRTGTGTVPAPRNPVTFGVFRTIYQLSLVTIMRTRRYPGKIFFLRFTFSPHLRTDILSCVGINTSMINCSSPNASRRCMSDDRTLSSVPDITRMTYHSQSSRGLRRSNIGA
jgi:hypothetical protein